MPITVKFYKADPNGEDVPAGSITLGDDGTFTTAPPGDGFLTSILEEPVFVQIGDEITDVYSNEDPELFMTELPNHYKSVGLRAEIVPDGTEDLDENDDEVENANPDQPRDADGKFSSGGGTGEPKGMSDSKANKLVKSLEDEEEGEIPSPFDVFDPEINPAVQEAFQNIKKDKLKVEKVPLEGLVGTHESVYSSKVVEYLKDPGKVSTEGTSSELPQDKPIIVRVEGTDYIFEGHHRLTADKLSGRSTREAYVYEP